MRRLITLTAAFLIAASIVYMAMIWREQAIPPPPTDLTRVLALLDEPTPTGQLADSVAVPQPNAVPPTLSHPFFPLTDSHADVPCAACHVDGMGVDIGATCVTCHLADDVHNGANGSDCATCHAPVGWQFVEFDHSTIGDQDCASCHQPPPNHYPGVCATCHLDTMSFANAFFDHVNLMGQDCIGCHQPPPNHYAGICANCHIDTLNFLTVQFDHSFISATDCAACHQPPPDHFQGSCLTCHQDTTDFHNATFNHTFPLNHGGANGVCTTCHVNNNPPAYSCTGCHRDSAELTEEHNDEGIFDLSNCVRCHLDGEEPDD